MPFICSFAGHCEENRHQDGYRTLAECQTECQAQEQKDILYEIMTNTPEEAQALAPSDQAEVVWRLWELRLLPAVAVRLLAAVHDIWQAWEVRQQYPALRDYYIDSLYDPVEVMYYRIWGAITPADDYERGHDDFDKMRDVLESAVVDALSSDSPSEEFVERLAYELLPLESTFGQNEQQLLRDTFADYQVALSRRIYVHQEWYRMKRYVRLGAPPEQGYIPAYL